ncbi:hypothetical protein ILUMI_12987 [Ignelater luminosus]|uniref:Uncharacterized protein n=1 Tax=Ignelater luminosus TaxID=2038154 RepID=A0A8K0CXG8_IGNLU|nr:hypothetical protein ILUMI_12987 [Ignelater luminosus]
MKLIIYSVLLFSIFQFIRCQLTEKQLQASTKMVRNVCQPKNKVTDAQIDAMHKGEFPEDRSLMCYMECCLRTARLMKDGKADLDIMLKQIQTLPESRREPTIESAMNCKDSITGTEKCEIAYQIYKCLYEDNPDNFFLP